MDEVYVLLANGPFRSEEVRWFDIDQVRYGYGSL